MKLKCSSLLKNPLNSETDGSNCMPEKDKNILLLYEKKENKKKLAVTQPTLATFSIQTHCKYG